VLHKVVTLQVPESRSLATAFHLSVVARLAGLLIAKGAKVNTEDKWGYSPLHTAAKHGYDNIAENLIDAGADVNAEDVAGQTPLEFAKQRGFNNIVELLRKHGAKE